MKAFGFALISLFLFQQQISCDSTPSPISGNQPLSLGIGSMDMYLPPPPRIVCSPEIKPMCDKFKALAHVCSCSVHALTNTECIHSTKPSFTYCEEKSEARLLCDSFCSKKGYSCAKGSGCSMLIK